MECPMLLVFLLLGLWSATQGAVLLGPGHHALTSWRFDGDAVRRRCLERSVTKVSCAGVGVDRLLPHPDDCELFYYCVGNVTICRQCPAGLHFSPNIHVCDRPEDAGCTPPPNTTAESSPPSTSISDGNFTTSTSSAPINSLTSPTILSSSTSIDNSSSTTPSEEVTSATSSPGQSTATNSLTSYIKLQ